MQANYSTFDIYVSQKWKMYPGQIEVKHVEWL